MKGYPPHAYIIRSERPPGGGPSHNMQVARVGGVVPYLLRRGSAGVYTMGISAEIQKQAFLARAEQRLYLYPCWQKRIQRQRAEVQALENCLQAASSLSAGDTSNEAGQQELQGKRLMLSYDMAYVDHLDKAINALNDDYRAVIHCRYIVSMAWEDVACKLHMSVKEVRNMARLAVEKFAAIYEQNKQKARNT